MCLMILDTIILCRLYACIQIHTSGIIHNSRTQLSNSLISSIRCSFFSSSLIIPSELALVPKLDLCSLYKRKGDLHKLLAVLDLQHPLFHTFLYDEPANLDLVYLPHAVHAINSLSLDGETPPWIHHIDPLRHR
jgi:hypothetical protein